MGLFTKDIQTMEDLLLHGLQDIYYAEQQITKALPKMIEKATNRDLAQGLKNHLEETNKQIERLDQVFKKLNQSPKGTDCPAIDGLIKEWTRQPVRLRTKTFWTPLSSPMRRRSSTMRWRVTVPSSPGPKPLAMTRSFGF